MQHTKYASDLLRYNAKAAGRVYNNTRFADAITDHEHWGRGRRLAGEQNYVQNLGETPRHSTLWLLLVMPIFFVQN
jgi:hypothetical protein